MVPSCSRNCSIDPLSKIQALLTARHMSLRTMRIGFGSTKLTYDPQCHTMKAYASFEPSHTSPTLSSSSSPTPQLLPSQLHHSKRAHPAPAGDMATHVYTHRRDRDRCPSQAPRSMGVEGERGYVRCDACRPEGRNGKRSELVH